MKKKSYTIYFYSSDTHYCIRQQTIVSDSYLTALIDATKLKSKNEYVGRVEL